MAFGLAGVIGLVAAIGAAEGGEEWVALTRTDNVVIGVERGSVSRDGDVVTYSAINAWLRSEAGAYAVSTMRLNCAERSLRIGRRTSYDRQGKRIETFPTESPPMQVESGSTLADVADAVCDNVWIEAFSAPTSLAFYEQSVIELATH